MKIKQLYTPKDFEKLDKVLLFDVWYRQALTDKQVGKLFGVTAADVKKKREKLGIRWMNSAIASLSGGQTFTSKKKLVEIHPPKDWDGNPIKFKPGKYKTVGEYKVSGLEAEGNAIDPKEPVQPVQKELVTENKASDEFSSEDAAATWRKVREQELAEKDKPVTIAEQLIIDAEVGIQIQGSNKQSK